MRSISLHALATPPVDLRDTPPEAADVVPITQLAEADAPELADNGRRLALVEHDPEPVAAPLETVDRMRLELGTSRANMALERLEDARLELREAMKLVDTTEDRDLHIAITEQMGRHDDLLAVIKERCS